MKISIIIINYKTKEMTSDCIESVLQFESKIKLEVIVVDNDSGEDEILFLKNKFDNKVKFIANDVNIGFGGANNQAAKIAQGDLLFFLNSDTIVGENIFEKIIDNFNDSSIGMVSPFLLTGERVAQSHAFGVFPDIHNTIFKKKVNYKVNSNKLIEVDWFSGAAMVVRKEVFEKIGSFDENFFMYFEDIDLCRRIKNIEKRIIVDKNISIIHLGGKSLEEHSKRKRMYYDSQNYYFKKYYGFFAMMLVRFIRAPYKLINYLIVK